jgi:hypothetical protein
MSSIVKRVGKLPLVPYLTGFVQDVTISTLRTGPIPRHIAFIMDGNRRYAKTNNLELGEGYYAGFGALVSVSIFDPSDRFLKLIPDFRSVCATWSNGSNNLCVFD